MAVASLTPVSIVQISPDGAYSADDTGGWYDAAAETLASQDVNDFISAKLGSSSGWSTRHWFVSYELVAPPLLDSIRSVTARAVLDSYSANALAVDLQLQFFLVIGGVRYLGSQNPVSGSTPTTSRQFREFEEAWSLNPATGAAFTAADLAPSAIAAGFRFGCATDPAGASINLTGTGMCCTEFEVEVDGAAGQSVEVVRHVLSSHLLRNRKMHETCSIEVAMQYGDVGIMEAIWLASDKVPSDDGLGSGPEVVKRAPYLVLQKTPRLRTRTWKLKLWDLKSFVRSYWSPMVTDITADAQDNGIARIDRGGGWSVTRTQAGYVKRPPEGLWKNRDPNTPRYHKDYGLLICGGGQRWSANNTFSQGFGGPGPLGLGIGLNYSFWNFSPDLAIPWDQASDSAHRTEELFELLFDVDGIRRGVKLHDGYHPGYLDVPIYALYTWDVAAGAKVRAYMKYFADYGAGYNGGASLPKWCLLRRVGGVWNYWLPGTGWTASVTWNAPDQFGIVGSGPAVTLPWEEFWTEEVDVGADACSLTIFCGNVTHTSGPGVGPQTVIFGAAGMVESNGNAHCFPREFLVTTTDTTVQEADDVEINNDEDYRVWDVARGTVHFGVTWSWRHADLADGDVKHLISCHHATTGGVRDDRLFYERIDATSGRLVFRRQNAAGNPYEAVYPISGADLPGFLRTDKIGLRWTSDLEELALPAQTHSIFFNRERGTDGAVAGTVPTQIDGETRVYPGRVLGCSNDEYADCYLRHFEAYPWCLTDADLLRALSY